MKRVSREKDKPQVGNPLPFFNETTPQFRTPFLGKKALPRYIYNHVTKAKHELR
jgi:hypothetical protein